MKLANIIKTAAVAGLIGFGAAATTTTPAQAENYRRCDASGCYKVHCDRYRGCYRVGGYYSTGYRGYYGSSYYAPGAYYGPGYGGYYRSVRVCDRWGCHYVRRYEPSAQVELGIRF